MKAKTALLRSSCLYFSLFFMSFVASALNCAEAHAEEKSRNYAECSEQALLSIRELLKGDSNGLLAQQLELTTLKLARRVVKTHQNTLEGYLRKKTSQLKKLDDGTLGRLRETYQRHGMTKDHWFLIRRLEKSNYLNSSTRIENEDVSATILALTLTEKNGDLGVEDAAISWLMDTVSKRAIEVKGRHSRAHNQTLISHHIARYTGVIADGSNLSEGELTVKIDSLEAEIRTIFEELKTSPLLAGCFSGEQFGGTVCRWDATFQNRLLSDAIESLQAELLQNPEHSVVLQEELQGELKIRLNAESLLDFEELLSGSAGNVKKKVLKKPKPKLSKKPDSSIITPSNPLPRVRPSGKSAPARKPSFTKADLRFTGNDGKLYEVLSRYPGNNSDEEVRYYVIRSIPSNPNERRKALVKPESYILQKVNGKAVHELLDKPIELRAKKVIDRTQEIQNQISNLARKYREDGTLTWAQQEKIVDQILELRIKQMNEQGASINPLWIQNERPKIYKYILPY